MVAAGATQFHHFKKAREILPEHGFLVPGIGLQGGSISSVMQVGRANSGLGLLFNASRSISQGWKKQEEPGHVAQQLQSQTQALFQV